MVVADFFLSSDVLDVLFQSAGGRGERYGFTEQNSYGRRKKWKAINKGPFPPSSSLCSDLRAATSIQVHARDANCCQDVRSTIQFDFSLPSSSVL